MYGKEIKQKKNPFSIDANSELGGPKKLLVQVITVQEKQQSLACLDLCLSLFGSRNLSFVTSGIRKRFWNPNLITV